MNDLIFSPSTPFLYCQRGGLRVHRIGRNPRHRHVIHASRERENVDVTKDFLQPQHLVGLDITPSWQLAFLGTSSKNGKTNVAINKGYAVNNNKSDCVFCWYVNYHLWMDFSTVLLDRKWTDLGVCLTRLYNRTCSVDMNWTPGRGASVCQSCINCKNKRQGILVHVPCHCNSHADTPPFPVPT